MPSAVLEHINELVSTLPPEDKLRLIGELSRQLLTRTESQTPEAPLPDQEKKPYRSLRGALKHLGPAPSAEDIDEVRREVWANFPSEDI